MTEVYDLRFGMTEISELNKKTAAGRQRSVAACIARLAPPAAPAPALRPVVAAVVVVIVVGPAARPAARLAADAECLGALAALELLHAGCRRAAA